MAASQGDSAAMLEVLQQVSQVSTQQQEVTGTTPTGGTAGQPNRNAPVPPQATGTVSLLNGVYVVKIVNPGATSPLSQIQAAQQGTNATAQSTVQAVKAIYHQIRVSTSPAFNVNSNTQTFGGDTGNAQTYWTITGLGSGTWCVQFRSSYDGINFNTWKNSSRGNAVSLELVTLESESNAVWAVLDLPGGETIAVCEGFGEDGAGFGLPNGVYSSAMFSIVSPNGFNVLPPQISTVIESDVTLQTPLGGGSTGLSGIADYPAGINIKYGNRSNPQSSYSANGNLFAIAFNPSGKNVTVYDSSDGSSSWAVFTLPGGAKLAVGSGYGPDGSMIYIPTQTPWITAANLLSIVSIQGGDGTGRGAGGFKAKLSGLTIEASYRNYDSADTWSGQGNWLAVSWTPGLVTESVTGGEFLILNLAGGNKIAFGAGSLFSGSSFSLPAGFTSEQMVSIPTPAGFSNNNDNCLHAISNCSISGTTVNLNYVDGAGNDWSGDVNWFAFCWADALTTSPVGPGIVVTINPVQINLNEGDTFTFAATVAGTGTTTVTWSVDGVAGGNGTVGTIVAGLYTAPASTGSHVITAASTVNPARYGVAVADVA